MTTLCKHCGVLLHIRDFPAANSGPILRVWVAPDGTDICTWTDEPHVPEMIEPAQRLRQLEETIDLVLGLAKRMDPEIVFQALRIDTGRIPRPQEDELNILIRKVADGTASPAALRKYLDDSFERVIGEAMDRAEKET